MARIRSIHPGLFTDESYMSLSLGAKAIWPGIWTEADDHGVFEWKPVTFKARLMPNDNVDMAELMAETLKHGLTIQFSHEGKQYGVIKGFLRWQRPKSPSYRYPFPKAAEIFALNSGGPTPALPDSYTPTPEKSPQREEGGGRRKEEGVTEQTVAKATARRSAPDAERFKLPTDWRPSEDGRDYARDKGLDAATSAEAFSDYFTQGRGRSEKRDGAGWEKRFRIWCNTDAERKTSRVPGVRPAGTGGDAGAFARAANRLGDN